MISGDDGSGINRRRQQQQRRRQRQRQCQRQRQRRFIEVTHLIIVVLIATTRTCCLANGAVEHNTRRFSFDRKKCQQSSQYDNNRRYQKYNNNDDVMSVLGENDNEIFEKQKRRSLHNRLRTLTDSCLKNQQRFSPRQWFDVISHRYTTTTTTAIIQCRSLPSPRLYEYNQVLVLRGGENREDTASSGVYNRFNSIRRGNSSINSSSNNKRNVQHNKNHSPVVYQYFGKSRSRGHQYPSSQATDDAQLNFILLGPNVDHWKAVGQILASRGFNVMACERMIPDENNDEDNNYEASTMKFDDAPELVLEILDALKWEKAVLVGCDDDGLLAVESAMILAPERVAGLILCGDLKKANQLAMEAGGVSVLDSFLHRILDCPFVIVWDGGARSIVSGSSAHEAIETASSAFDSLTGSSSDSDSVDGRCVILGGGSAPHRTKPEYFAWVLARFVEEKIEYHPKEYVGGNRRSSMTEVMDEDEHNREKGTGMRTKRQNRGRILDNLNLPFGIDSVVSSEGRLLLGRALAAAIFYYAITKTVIVQYGVIRLGWTSIKNSVDSVDALRRKVSQATGAFIWNFGYIPRLLRFSFKRTKDTDEDDVSSSKIVDEDSSADPNEESIENVTDEENMDDPGKRDEEEDNESTFRIKPLFFLDNIFT